MKKGGINNLAGFPVWWKELAEAFTKLLPDELGTKEHSEAMMRLLSKIPDRLTVRTLMEQTQTVG